MEIIFCFGAFIIFEAMVGYPATLFLIDKLLKPKKNEKDIEYEPSVTLMIVAHNEEKVIHEKLVNAISMDYPREKYSIIVASDNSTDDTNKIVEDFIKNNLDYDIRIYSSVNHYGKTNAQNEAQKHVSSEILVMTDANAMLEKNSLKELVSSFSDKDVAYVSGQLKYINIGSNQTASSEGFYWKLDLICRDIESRMQTITAGNGAIYAVRNDEYIDISPIDCHDSAFPIKFALCGKRALYNSEAIAYEKAGEIDKEEFERKARTSRLILRRIIPNLRIFNVFKMKWFSFFYFGHRTCRYLLWFAHGMVLLSNIVMARKSKFWKGTLAAQLLFYFVGLVGKVSGSKNKIIRLITYYLMTVLAQWKAVGKLVLGKTDSTWEKADSTR